MTKIYTEVVFEWCEENQRMIEVSSESFNYEGPMAMCGGGSGGSSGEVQFAAYIEAYHKTLMDDTGGDALNSALTVFNAANLALTADPYQLVNAHNPDTSISDIDTTFNAEYAHIVAMNPATNIRTYATEAKAAYDSIVNDTEINESVEDFDNETNPEFQTQLSQFTGAMADIGAVNSSAFIFGLANMHRKRWASVKKYRSDLKMKSWDKRLDYIMKAKAMMLQVLSDKTKMGASYASLSDQVAKTKVQMKNDQTKFDAEFDVKNAMWEMNLVERGMKAIGAPGGGSAVVPNEPSQGQSALAGAASGAAAGAALGPWGAAAGAGIGALMSLA